MLIDLDVQVDVDYEIVDDPSPDRHHPIDIKQVKLRGRDITNNLHVGHIMTLQRRIHNRLINDKCSTLPENRMGL